MMESPLLKKIELDEKSKEELITLGSLRWEEKKIASFFGWDQALLHEAMQDNDSEISKLLLQGELRADFEIEARLYEKAKGGDIPSAKHFAEVVHNREFKLSKLDLFGGAEDKDLFSKVQKFLENNDASDFTTEQQIGLEMMQLTYSLDVKLGDRKTIKLLTRQPYGLTYNQAKDLLGYSIELFNGGRRVTREAMRSHMAETYDTLYHLVLDTARTTQDLAIAKSILDQKSKILALDKPEEPMIQAEKYTRMYRVLSLTPESLGLPAANRDELAAQIDALEIPDKERQRLKMEAGVIDTDIAKMMENAVQDAS